MRTEHKYKNLNWIELNNPTREEIHDFVTNQNLDIRTVQELVIPNPKPKIELHDGYIYLVLHFPVFRHSHKDSRQEIDFVIGKDFLITSRYDTVDALERYVKVLEVDSILEKRLSESSTSFIFFGLLREIYKSMQNELDAIENELGSIEKKIFEENKQKEMVFALASVSKKLHDFKKIFIMHEDILKSLEIAWKIAFKVEDTANVNFTLEEYYKVQKSTDSLISLMSELRETNNSLLETKQNADMKVLTVLAFVFLPMTTFIAMFQINTANPPLNNFWQILLTACCIGILTYLIIKFKKWI